ncbi:flagellar biosynthesis protein FlhG [Alicyclobacillus sacchari]|uniref:Flagellar biosynthesis protein FlhG n=1 Tax=Alicyclobacillus sacchari TaxID=392010 RepID=A0A4R8LUQ3_9BACL|nr:MinD/ParA family protein [Alicyclobacillus sacchari]TDY50497.1 flagellar biosynthesis protein FlhG [Alicyclobacillus sacchari]GMA59026.1 ATPase [Alicyclobacillus sacchari]
MADQASRLRKQMELWRVSPESAAAQMGQISPPPRPSSPSAHVIAVASGKGGVGKSNFCVNFGLALVQRGLRVVVIDADVGFANVEVLLNIAPSHSLLDLLEDRSLEDIVEHSPHGLSFVSGGSGLFTESIVQHPEADRLMRDLQKLSSMYDVILFDCAAGADSMIRRVAAACDDFVLLVTPEPTSLTDSYSLLKWLAAAGVAVSPKVVINRVHSLEEGRETAKRLQLAAGQFLAIEVSSLGYVMDDPAVVQAVMRQVPLMIHSANSRAALCYRQVAERYLQVWPGDVPQSSTAKGFFERLLSVRRMWPFRAGDHGG